MAIIWEVKSTEENKIIDLETNIHHILRQVHSSSVDHSRESLKMAVPSDSQLEFVRKIHLVIQLLRPLLGEKISVIRISN